MNILMLAARFHPHIGGVEKHLRELCTVLIRRGHLITIFTEQYDSALPAEEEIQLDSGWVRVIRVARRKSLALLGRLSLLRSADVVHCHDYIVFLYWYLPLKIFFPFKPVFITFHGWEGVFPPRITVVFLRKLTEHLTRANICIGEFICRWYGTKADYISYGGVTANSETRENRGEDAVFVGRLAPDTGIKIYLEALRLLQERGVTIPLTVCGDGPLKTECEQFARLHGLAVSFTGFVPNPQNFIKNARFVFVSGYLAILEAMSMGKLVFSVFDNPLKEDYLKLMPHSAEMMFSAGSPEELAAQLERCMADELSARNKSTRALQWAGRQSWEQVADVYERLWAGM